MTPNPKTVTTLEAAALLGLHHDNPVVLRSMVRRELGRLKVTSLYRLPGRGGESVYDARQIRTAAANRKRRGRPAKNEENPT